MMRSIAMIRIVAVLALANISLSFWIAAASCQTSEAVVRYSIADLGWMAGSWQTAPGGRARIEEHWTAAAGGSMLGMSRTVVGVRTVEFEYLRLEQRADGIYYVAHPEARCPGTDFKLTNLTKSEAVFENPQHDFPKRIIYRQSSDGVLVASIDGGEGTKAKSFSYRRMKK